MPLKKNDKIIIAVGIIILLVAGTLIVFYTQPTEEIGNVTPQNPQGTTYEVNWTVEKTSLSTIDQYAGKTAPYQGTFMISHGNLKSITLNLSWVDDKALLKRFGLDTLTIEVTTPDGDVVSNSAVSARKTKEGNVNLEFRSITIAPSDTPIQANSTADAQNRLTKLPYYNDKWVNKEFTYTVSVTVGEKILRFRDKGNQFTLNINYEYYSPEVSAVHETVHEPQDPVKDTSLGPAMGLIIPTGNFGRW